MKAADSPGRITHSALQTYLHSYPSHVSPKIQSLDLNRLDDIPETLAQRKADGVAFLEKIEVTGLVEWKLKHGTYRPSLAKLVASNSAKDIRETTQAAFEIYEADNDDCSRSITTLTNLKGIGPATASLLLSCYDPVRVPFFSDELYRYLHFEDAKSKGWDRKINYTMKEYKSLYSKVQVLRDRLGGESKQQVSAIDTEKVAYVLGKEAISSVKPLPGKKIAEADPALPPPSAKRRKKNNDNPPKLERPNP